MTEKPLNIVPGIQTGEEQTEEGVQTDSPETDSQSTQCPELTIKGASDDESGARLLPFLQRVLPLFEANLKSMSARMLSKGAKSTSDQAKEVGANRGVLVFLVHIDRIVFVPQTIARNRVA